MNNLSNIICFIFISLMTILMIKKNTEKFLMISLIGIFVCPQLSILEIKIDFSYVFIAIFILDILFNRMKIRKIKNIILKLMLLETAIYLLSTLLNLLHPDRQIILMNIIGQIKNLVIFIVIYNFTNGKENININNIISPSIRIIVIINLIFMGIQYLNPMLGIDIIKTWYSNSNSLTLTSNISTLHRLYGASYSPVITGYNMLLCLALEVTTKRNSMWIILMLCVGLMTTSKTFILGSICIFLYFFYIELKNKILIERIKFLAKIILICTIILIVINQLLESNTNLYLDYYLKESFNIKNVLFNRVKETNDFTSDMINVIINNPIFGLGYNILGNYKVADSDILITLYYGGICALIIHMCIYCKMLFTGFIKKEKKLIIISLLVVLVGIGQNSLFIPNTLAILGIILGDLDSKK